MGKVDKDPIGQAILHFAATGRSEDIIVSSDICDDDTIPSAYLFRSFEEMPEIEQVALQSCEGKILDVGAAAGAHALWLQEHGKQVECIDISPGAVAYLKEKGLSAKQIDFMELSGVKYDTLLILMNGIGIAGSLKNLDDFLSKAKDLMDPDGKILCDSTDIKYLYEDEDGGYWIDITNVYYGNFQFKMRFMESEGDWFPWLYVDFDTLRTHAIKNGFEVEKLFEEESHYLAELKLKHA